MEERPHRSLSVELRRLEIAAFSLPLNLPILQAQNHC